MTPTKTQRRAAHTLFKPLRTVTTYPLGHLLNPATRYTPAANTDVAKTFARVRAQQAAAKAEAEAKAQPDLFGGQPA